MGKCECKDRKGEQMSEARSVTIMREATTAETMPEQLKRIATETGDMLQEKSRSYGGSFAKAGEIFRVLYPDGIRPDQYDDVLLAARMLDKFFRIANRKPGAVDNGGEDPARDLAGYSVCWVALNESKGLK